MANKYLKQEGEVIYPITLVENVLCSDGNPATPFVYFEAQRTKDNGNLNFAGELLFDTIIIDTANGWNASTKRWTCPYKGVYYVSWSYFSNSPKTDGSVRPSIYINGYNRLFASTQPATLSGVFYLGAGDTISAGCYSGTGNLYSGSNHNRFVITLVQRVE